jgi:hypothetical protein
MNIDVVETVLRAYGGDSDDCEFCAGKGGMHHPVRRRDGAYTRCSAGDVRVLLRMYQAERGANLANTAELVRADELIGELNAKIKELTIEVVNLEHRS